MQHQGGMEEEVVQLLIWGTVSHPSTLSFPTVKHGYVFKKCGPDGQWVTSPEGKSLRDGRQCMMDNETLLEQVSVNMYISSGGCLTSTHMSHHLLPFGKVNSPQDPVLHSLDSLCFLFSQNKFARIYGSFKVMYTVGYSVSLCALILALAVLLGFRCLGD